MTTLDSKKYKVVRGLVHPSVLDLIAEYYRIRSKERYMTKDGTGIASVYADPISEALMMRLKPEIEGQAGKKLLPTYSFMRVYGKGNELEKHTDRFACEYSITMPIIYGADKLWPIYVETGEGELAVDLERGDVLIYKGIEVPHWREKFTGEFWMQIFVHFVDAEGPYKEWHLDKRERLGVGVSNITVIPNATSTTGGGSKD